MNMWARFFCLFLFINSLFLISIQDLHYSKYAEIFRTPFVIILFLWVYVYFVLSLYNMKRLVLTSIEKNFFLYVFYIFVIGFLYLLFLLFKNINIDYIVLIRKTLTIPLYYFFFAFAVLFFRYIISCLSLRIIFYSIAFIIFILSIVFIFELIYYPYFAFLHSEVPYYRIRLLTHESSWAGSLVLVYISLLIITYILLDKKKIIDKLIFLLSLIFFANFLYFSGSKGLLIVILIALIISCLRYAFLALNLNLLNVIFLTLFIILFIKWGINYLQSNLILDLENFTSISTRITLILSSIMTLVHHPLGVGGSGFIPYTIYYSNDVLYFLNRYLKFFVNGTELHTIFSPPYKNLAIKSFFFNNLTLGGTIFIIFFAWLYFEISSILKQVINPKNTNFYLLLLSYTFFYAVFLSIIIYMNLDVKYQYSIFFAFFSFLKYLKQQGVKNDL